MSTTQKIEPAHSTVGVLQQLGVQRYRRLLDIDIEMRPLAVLIGANGVGKTSLLQVFSLLAAAARGDLQNQISELGGLPSLITNGEAGTINFSLKMAAGDKPPLLYDLRLSPQGQFYRIGSESLAQQTDSSADRPFYHIQSQGADVRYYDPRDHQLVQPNWEHSLLETSLSQVPKMYQQAEQLRRTLASCTFYGPLDIAPGSPVRLPQPLRPASLPGSNGENLVSCLYDLRETDMDRFQVLEDTLQAAFPDFERLNFPAAAAGMLSLTWKDKNYAQPFYLTQLSEGTLRFLWLSSLLLSRDLTAITLLDEPEVSLHPKLLALLADLMREASQHTQLVVATHSERLVRFLKPKELLVCDDESGATSMTWADNMDLERWLQDYTLDELWEMNVLGGRP